MPSVVLLRKVHSAIVEPAPLEIPTLLPNEAQLVAVQPSPRFIPFAVFPMAEQFETVEFWPALMPDPALPRTSTPSTWQFVTAVMLRSIPSSLQLRTVPLRTVMFSRLATTAL